MAKTLEELEAEKKAAVTRTVRDVAKEGVAKVGKGALTGAKAVSKMKSGVEKYAAGKLIEGADAVAGKVSEMAPLDAVGAAAKVAKKASNPVSAIANAIGDIEVGGGGGGEPAEVGPSSEAGKKAFEIERVGMYQQSKANQAALNKPMGEEAQGAIDLLASRRLDADLQGKSTELAGGAPQKDFRFGSAVDDVMGAADNGKFNASPIEGAAEFDKEFGELSKSIGRAKEGETADQYEGRLRERNAERAELQSQKPYESAVAGTFNKDGQSDLPTITSPQAKSSAQAVADKPASGQTPPSIQSPQAKSSAQAVAQGSSGGQSYPSTDPSKSEESRKGVQGGPVLQTGGLGEKRLIGTEGGRLRRLARKAGRDNQPQVQKELYRDSMIADANTPAIRSQEYRYAKGQRKEKISEDQAQEEKMKRKIIDDILNRQRRDEDTPTDNVFTPTRYF